MNFEGLISPLVTPFTADTSGIDETALRQLVDTQISDGVGGLVSCGTTGEFSALSVAERKTVTEVIVDQAAGRVPVMVGTGSTSTAEAIGLSRHASAAGAAGLLLPPPYYGSLTEDEITTFYRAVAAETDLPICIYNIPSATGIGMSTDTLVALAQIPHVQYIKDSSADLEQQTAFLTEHHDTLGLFCGEELLVAPGLMLGLRAAVVGSANLLAPGLVSLVAAGQARDFDEVARINAELTPLMRFIVTHPYVATVKEAMNIVGADIGPVREPFLPLESGARDELKALLASINPDLLTTSAKVS